MCRVFFHLWFVQLKKYYTSSLVNLSHLNVSVKLFLSLFGVFEGWALGANPHVYVRSSDGPVQHSSPVSCLCFSCFTLKAPVPLSFKQSPNVTLAHYQFNQPHSCGP